MDLLLNFLNAYLNIQKLLKVKLLQMQKRANQKYYSTHNKLMQPEVRKHPNLSCFLLLKKWWAKSLFYLEPSFFQILKNIFTNPLINNRINRKSFNEALFLQAYHNVLCRNLTRICIALENFLFWIYTP